MFAFWKKQKPKPHPDLLSPVVVKVLLAESRSAALNGRVAEAERLLRRARAAIKQMAEADKMLVAAALDATQNAYEAAVDKTRFYAHLWAA